jgi:ankyrin repeat protein
MKKALHLTLVIILLVVCSNCSEKVPDSCKDAGDDSETPGTVPSESVEEISELDHVAAKEFFKTLAYGELPKVKEYIKKLRDVNIRDLQGNTLLHIAARRPRSEVAKLLLARGADVNANNNWGASPLHMVQEPMWSEDRNPEEAKAFIELLLANGADINARDDKGRTPLWKVTGLIEGTPELVPFLTSKGADINARDRNGETVLDTMVYFKNYRMAKLLKENGGKFANPDRELIMAAYEGNLERLKELLAGGANLSSSDIERNSSLHVASMKGHKQTVDFLLGNGANPNILNLCHQTPLHLTSSVKVAESLINHGADMSVKDSSHGDTALHKTTKRGNIQLTALLVKSGCQTDPVNRNGKTPLDYAETDEIKTLLRSHDAKTSKELQEEDNVPIETLVAALAKFLPNNWVIVETRHGQVEPVHWLKGDGWHIGMQRIGFEPIDWKKGKAGDIRVWIMDKGYAPKESKYPAGAPQVGAAQEVNPWHGRRVLIWGGAKDWVKWKDNVLSALKSTVETLTTPTAPEDK